LSWFALVPLLLAIHETNWKQSLILGFITGIIYTLGTMNWFMVLGPFSSWFWVALGFLALALYLSTYVFIFAVYVNYISRYWIFRSGNSISQRIAYIFLIGIVWTAMEVLKGYVATGFPWANLGHAQWRYPVIIQISAITGMYGVTFLVAIINGAVADFLINIHKWKTSLKVAFIPLLILIASITYGLISMGHSDGEKIKVALVPGNINQMDKIMSWEDPTWIYDIYKVVSEKAASEKPDLIVWPETSVPRYLLRFDEVPDELKALLHKWNAYLLLGIPHVELFPERKTYNAAFLISPEGKEVDRYYKNHLVPVSEYFPMKNYLPKSWQDMVTGISDWDHGISYTVFNMGKARFGCVICFESVFPGIFRAFKKQDVNLMGIITNDSWFDGTFAPEQHYSVAPFRAVENRTAVFRCANKGISCIIDPWGRIVKETRSGNNDSYLVGDVYLHSGKTLYTHCGDYLPWACLAMTVLLAFFPKFRRL